MFGQIGPLEAFWFISLSTIGLYIGYRMGGSTTKTIMGMEEGTAQLSAHSAMVMALACNAETMRIYWAFLLAALPQPGTDINALTAAIAWGLTALFWVFTPLGVAIARIEIIDWWRNAPVTKH
ncbi:MAG: hypothetical protein AWU57_359 [Marinobacter sp. T13-3]|nr:MAG: hypothetical protein AWU57_359 [Marinobacter sp. T13-3]